MARRALGALIITLCAACAEPDRSVPTPTSVTPLRGAESAAVAVTVFGEHFDPLVFADYRRASQSLLSVGFSAQLEDEAGAALPLEEVLWLDARTLTAVVPATTPRGHYSLVVTDPQGRSGRLTDAFQVVSSAENVSGFLFDALGPQMRGIPFLVGVTAIDQESAPVEGFEGSVTITDSQGTFAPTALGPFVRGQARAFFTVDALATALVLTAQDDLGHRGDSEPFDVRPGVPARVTFVGGPNTLPAGDCGGPFELESQDTGGRPAPDAAAMSVALSANPPEGVSFFVDAACQTSLAAAPVDADATRTAFFARATRAGPVELRASPPGLPSALQRVQVQPLPPSQLAFASPGASFRAGECSPDVEIEAEDLYGNPSAPSAPLPLSVSIDPPGGVTLHSDSACASALGALELAGGQTIARFHFRPTSPQTLRVVVRGLDGGSVEQHVEVLP